MSIAKLRSNSSTCSALTHTSSLTHCKLWLLALSPATTQTFYLCGDFNVNISPESSTPSVNEFLNVILGNSAFSTKTIPTRVTENSKTIIDNIITYDSNIILPGIIQTDISDHFVIFSFTMNFNKSPKNNIKIFRRNKSKFNPEEFCRQLESNLQAFNPLIYNATPDNFNQLTAEFVALIENTIELKSEVDKVVEKST